MKEKKKEIIVYSENTLLNILTENLKDLSKKTIKNYIKYKMVEVDGRVITNANNRVLSNSKITIFFTPREIPKFNLEILYEDEDLIAINKPNGLLSISNSKEKEITAFRLVSDYIKKNNPASKLFVVHRLDQETSGILIFSKNKKLKEQLQERWNEIVKTREYICLVKGKMPKSGRFESYLTMNHFQKVYSTRNKEIGKLAITNYELIKYKNGLSLLKVNIETGRRNQIRAHLSEAGYPIIGDKKYGSRDNSINRLALHANKISFIDPRTNKIFNLECQIPREINNLIK